MRRFLSTVSYDTAAADERLRENRLAAARQQKKWREIPKEQLVQRGRGWLVDADTDVIYTVRAGHVFDPAGASVVYYPHGAELAYYVTDDQSIVFLEVEGRTWSEVIERKATNRTRTKAPRR